MDAVARIEKYQESYQYVMEIDEFQETTEIPLDDLRRNVPGFVAPQMYIYLDGTQLLKYLEDTLEITGKRIVNSFNGMYMQTLEDDFMADFIEAEEVVRKYFAKGTTFDYEGVEYTVIDSGKPLPQKGRGEPKTDIYVCAQSGDITKEFKLSYKKTNADFLENKMKSDRAEQIFGEDWKEIIEENTKRISDKFEETPVLFLDQRKKTEPGSMTLGWRFELFNKPQGGLSGKMENMTRDQVYEVYAGEKLDDRKRDAKVNGKVIPNSGVAEYILVTDEVESAQDIINRMQPIMEYIDDNPDIYFGCKALNYRSKKKKMEGNRALSVQVGWHVEDEKLSIDIEYDKPLMRDGKQMKAAVEKCLRLLQKKDATEFDATELEDIPVYKKENAD